MSFIAVAQQLGSGMLASLSIFVLTLVFSLPLGLLVAFGRKSRIKPVQWLVKLYISSGGVFRTILLIWNPNLQRV